MPVICEQHLKAPGWDNWMPMCTIDYYNVDWLNGMSTVCRTTSNLAVDLFGLFVPCEAYSPSDRITFTFLLMSLIPL